MANCNSRALFLNSGCNWGFLKNTSAKGPDPRPIKSISRGAVHPQYFLKAPPGDFNVHWRL